MINLVVHSRLRDAAEDARQLPTNYSERYSVCEPEEMIELLDVYELAGRYLEWDDLAARRIERTKSGFTCHSVDGHGMAGRCNCYEKNLTLTRDALRKRLT